MKKRILFVSHSAKFAGSEQFLFELMTGLQPFFDIHLLCPAEGKLAEMTRQKNIPVHVIPYFWFLTLRPFFWMQSVFLPANGITLYPLIRLIKKLRADLVYTNTCVTFSGALAAKLCGKRHLWHIHEAFGQGPHEYGFPFLSRKTLEKMIRKLSDSVLVNSRHIQECFGGASDQKPQVVYNGFRAPSSFPTDEEKKIIRRGLGIDETTAVISVVSSIQESKGQWFAIKAMTAILENHPRTKLLLAGGPTRGNENYQKRLAAEIGSHSWQDTVRILGYVPDISSIYSITDILLVPSLYEPFGRTMIEAAYYGVPAIASNVGGIPEIIENETDGLLVAVGNSEAIAQVVNDLLRDPQKRKRLGENAFRRIPPRFDMNLTVKKVAEIIGQTLA